MAYLEINNRYSSLANESCCLSCGGAVDHSKPLKGEVCIDLGCGRGTDAIRLADEVGDKGFVHGIDLSEGMILKAELTAKKIGIKNILFHRAELENLPIKDETVDLVISNCTINHSSDKQRVWYEIERVLRRGGRFVVSDIYSISEVPLEYRNDPQAVAECWAGAVTFDQYMDQLKKAGFSQIEIIEESKPYSKGKIEVASITIRGKKSNCCCS
jgi:arsenite methyltransferase